MKWITREKAHVDRIACSWLISRFFDRVLYDVLEQGDQQIWFKVTALDQSL